MHEVADDPEAAALAYFDEHLAKKSAAVARAARWPPPAAAIVPEAKRRIAEVERLYLEQLMKTRDANEGLAAFIAKRTAQWEHC